MLPVIVVTPVALTPVVPVLLCRLMPVAALLTVRPTKFSVPLLLLTLTPVVPPVIVVPLTFSVPLLDCCADAGVCGRDGRIADGQRAGIGREVDAVGAAPEIAMFIKVIFAAALELLIFTPLLTGLVTFMLLSDTVPVSSLMRTPSPVELAIVPPEPAVVPVPVTANVPAALFKSMPLTPPLVVTLVRVTFKGTPPAGPSMFTPSPWALEIAPPLTVSVPD